MYQCIFFYYVKKYMNVLSGSPLKYNVTDSKICVKIEFYKPVPVKLVFKGRGT